MLFIPAVVGTFEDVVTSLVLTRLNSKYGMEILSNSRFLSEISKSKKFSLDFVQNRFPAYLTESSRQVFEFVLIISKYNFKYFSLFKISTVFFNL